MTDLAEGAAAPDFDIPATVGRRLRRFDFIGQPFVLFFYPQAGSESCTNEVLDFDRLADRYAAAGVGLAGISPDPLRKLERFASRHGFSVTLGSDDRRETIERFGLWIEKNTFGRTYMGVERATFLFSSDGSVRKVWRSVKVRGHAGEVLDAARAVRKAAL